MKVRGDLESLGISDGEGILALHFCTSSKWTPFFLFWAFSLLYPSWSQLTNRESTCSATNFSSCWLVDYFWGGKKCWPVDIIRHMVQSLFFFSFFFFCAKHMVAYLGVGGLDWVAKFYFTVSWVECGLVELQIHLIQPDPHIFNIYLKYILYGFIIYSFGLMKYQHNYKI